jgi:hypothetical protein
MHDHINTRKCISNVVNPRKITLKPFHGLLRRKASISAEAGPLEYTKGMPLLQQPIRDSGSYKSTAS